jgi:hypothetical protein
MRIDDIQLIEHIEKYGLDWKRISSIMGKPENFIQSRYEKRLNPNLKYTKFTPEEDSLILEKYKIYGGMWNTISKFFTNRSSHMIKNRFYSNLKKKLNEDNINNHSNQNSFSMSNSNSVSMSISNSNTNTNPNKNVNTKIKDNPYIKSNDLLNHDLHEKQKFLCNNINNNINNNLIKIQLDLNNNCNIIDLNKLELENSSFLLNDSNSNNFIDNNNKNKYHKEKNQDNLSDNLALSFPLNDSKIKLLSNSDVSINNNNTPFIDDGKMDINEINNNFKNFFFENEDVIQNNNNNKKNDFDNNNNNKNENEIIYIDKKINNVNKTKFDENFLYQIEESEIKPFSIFTTNNKLKTSEYEIKEIKNVPYYDFLSSNAIIKNNNNNITNKNKNESYNNNNNTHYLYENLKKNMNDLDYSSPKGIFSNFFRKNTKEEKDIYLIENNQSRNELEKDKMELDEINIFSNLNQNNNYNCYESDEEENSLYMNSCYNHCCASSTKSELINNKDIDIEIENDIDINIENDLMSNSNSFMNKVNENEIENVSANKINLNINDKNNIDRKYIRIEEGKIIIIYKSYISNFSYRYNISYK